MEDEQKQNVGTDEGFLKTTAEAVGATLGKLAVKTGIAGPPVPVKRRKKTVSRPKTNVVAKRAPAAPKNAVKRAAKKRAPLRKKKGK